MLGSELSETDYIQCFNYTQGRDRSLNRGWNLLVTLNFLTKSSKCRWHVVLGDIRNRSGQSSQLDLWMRQYNFQVFIPTVASSLYEPIKRVQPFLVNLQPEPWTSQTCQPIANMFYQIFCSKYLMTLPFNPCIWIFCQSTNWITCSPTYIHLCQREEDGIEEQACFTSVSSSFPDRNPLTWIMRIQNAYNYTTNNRDYFLFSSLYSSITPF